MGAKASRLTSSERKDAMDAMYARYSRGFCESNGEPWPEVGVGELLNPDEALAPERRMLSPGALFVDCRTAGEIAVSRIPGSITERELRAKLRDGLPEPREAERIVMYCTIGYRSGRQAAKLQAENPSLRVHNMAGSILAWSHAGGPLVDSAGKPTKRLHVFARKWDLARDDYETVMFV